MTDYATEHPPPHLEGARVVLRPPVLDDADALFERIAGDPDVTRFLLWPTHSDVVETRRVLMDRVISGQKERTWAITLRRDAAVVGLISCRRPVRYSVEVGYCLGRQWWDMGLMFEALNLVLSDLANDPVVYRVWATCHVDNSRSARLMQRAGFALEGRLRRHAIYPTMGPEPRDSLLYAWIAR